jgi:hypothetical protein
MRAPGIVAEFRLVFCAFKEAFEGNVIKGAKWAGRPGADMAHFKSISSFFRSFARCP